MRLRLTLIHNLYKLAKECEQIWSNNILRLHTKQIIIEFLNGTRTFLL